MPSIWGHAGTGHNPVAGSRLRRRGVGNGLVLSVVHCMWGVYKHTMANSPLCGCVKFAKIVVGGIGVCASVPHGGVLRHDRPGSRG
jgi:hypothetical protein